MFKPPQALITCPVTYELMSLAKNRVVLAISSAFPNLPNGILLKKAVAASHSYK
jgi:hypothetical protein